MQNVQHTDQTHHPIRTLQLLLHHLPTLGELACQRVHKAC